MSQNLDDELQLSSSTLAALNEFLKEKNEADTRFEAMKKAAHEESDKAAELAKQFNMDNFREDWQLSQFWYDLETRNRLAKEALDQTLDNGIIGCLCSPSAFVALKVAFLFEFTYSY